MKIDRNKAGPFLTRRPSARRADFYRLLIAWLPIIYLKISSPENKNMDSKQEVLRAATLNLLPFHVIG